MKTTFRDLQYYIAGHRELEGSVWKVISGGVIRGDNKDRVDRVVVTRNVIYCFLDGNHSTYAYPAADSAVSNVFLAGDYVKLESDNYRYIDFMFVPREYIAGKVIRCEPKGAVRPYEIQFRKDGAMQKSIEDMMFDLNTADWFVQDVNFREFCAYLGGGR